MYQIRLLFNFDSHALGLCRSIVVAFALSSAVAGEVAAREPDKLKIIAEQIEALHQQSRFPEAIPLAEQRLSLIEASPFAAPSEVARAQRRLAALYWNVGRYSDSARYHTLALNRFRALLGPRHAEVAASLNFIGDIHRDRGRYSLAEAYFKLALAIIRAPKGATSDMIVGSVQNSLGRLYRNMERYPEAEKLYNRALELRVKRYGQVDSNVGETVNNLGVIHHMQRRYDLAESYYLRSIKIKEATLPKDHIEVGRTLNNLAAVYREMERYTDAESLLRRSIKIREVSLGPGHAEVGQGYSNLGLNLRMQHRFTEAAEAYEKALKVREVALNPFHPDVGQTLHNIAAMYRELGRHDEADELYDRTLAIYRRVYPKDHDNITGTLMHKARLAVDREKWADAIALMRVAVKNHAEQARREASARRPPSAAYLSQRLADLAFLVRSLHRAISSVVNADEAAREAFELTQQGLSSEAALAVQQVAARQALGDDNLARLLRDRQDLAGKRIADDATLIKLVSMSLDGRDETHERLLRDRMAGYDARMREVDGEIDLQFPKFSTTMIPSTLTVQEFQRHLSEQEAAILVLATPELKPFSEEAFVWVITKTELRWVRVTLGKRSMNESIGAVRCGVDETLWKGIEEGRNCRRLLGLGNDFKRGRAPPFHLGVAHELYTELFGQVEDLIKDKHLLIVPSGPLTSLPFAALVTTKPEQALPSDAEGYRRVAWLGTRQPITVLPAVSSLYALRGLAKNGGQAPEPYLGFGDPDLKGRVKKCAKAPQLPADCPSVSARTRVAMAGDGGTRTPEELPPSEQFFKGGLADPVVVRSQCPLPESAFELRCVAKSLQAPPALVHTRQQATETALKAMPLDRYRVIHFATHGLLAVDAEKMAKGLAEPALVFTPPAGAATAEDDGLLTTSEITQLKLNADWVILSACNTAGSADKPGVEALSGLARAFFYAGARALLVSHWRVDSLSAVWLISAALEEMRADPGIGRSEALRRSMAALIANGAPASAHPLYWAPFVVVGEGAR